MLSYLFYLYRLNFFFTWNDRSRENQIPGMSNHPIGRAKAIIDGFVVAQYDLANVCKGKEVIMQSWEQAFDLVDRW
jgi:hypothetical protein